MPAKSRRRGVLVSLTRMQVICWLLRQRRQVPLPRTLPAESTPLPRTLPLVPPHRQLHTTLHARSTSSLLLQPVGELPSLPWPVRCALLMTCRPYLPAHSHNPTEPALHWWCGRPGQGVGQRCCRATRLHHQQECQPPCHRASRSPAVRCTPPMLQIQAVLLCCPAPCLSLLL